MTAATLRKKLHGYIDTMPEKNLAVIKPLSGFRLKGLSGKAALFFALLDVRRYVLPLFPFSFHNIIIP